MNGSAAEEAICLAFRRLLAEMPYDKVTVSAIAEASGLSSQTFYYHFGSVFGIVRRLCIGQGSQDWREDIAGAFRAASE